jgi:hypothetical protein
LDGGFQYRYGIKRIQDDVIARWTPRN